MNIEEERKAFLKMCSNIDINPTIGKFEIWLAAKAHAEEMAKPAVLPADTVEKLTPCFGGISVIRSSALSCNTMCVSDDVFEMLKAQVPAR